MSRAGQYATLAVLLMFAAFSWGWLMHAPAGGAMAMGPTMGLALVPFLGLWVVMMVAMMAPTAAPMILTYQAINARRTERSAVPARSRRGIMRYRRAHAPGSAGPCSAPPASTSSRPGRPSA
jgi:hypothetical protein